MTVLLSIETLALFVAAIIIAHRSWHTHKIIQRRLRS